MALMCPSMMCANFEYLKDEVIKLDKAGIDIFHCDIMDGSYVPNITMSLNDLKVVRNNTKKLVDVHLMIDNPRSKVQWFIDAGADIIYIHPDSEKHPLNTLHYIRERGVKAGIAVNPHVSIESIYEFLPYCDYLLVMSVHPGFAGQSFIETMIKKIEKLAKLKEEFGFTMIMDGACTPDRIAELSKKGMDGFVLGTSCGLFGKENEYSGVIKGLKGE